MLEPGTQVGRYEIQRRLGRGGMGAVYVAHDPVLGRMVAIKVFSGDLDFPEARERFSREARSAAALSHANIVTVYDYGEYAAQPYIVMEYVPGETLAQLIRRRAPVAIGDKLRWMEELCAGAGYAHQMSVIHRDIKPANLMIDRAGRLKVLDFGIARVMGLASNTTALVGTPGYMAPEQIRGDAVDRRADLFSIGVVFYELLAYTEAFPGETLASITHRIVTADPVPLSQSAPEVPPDAIAIVDRLLRKEPAERFDDAESVRVEIARLRLQLEAAPMIAPTIVRRDTPPPAGNRGTGSARRGTADTVGVAQMTPPPAKRTDREAVARRREEQIRAALAQARTLLDEGDLDAAYEACQQALTYDETHPEALDVEEAIRVAYAAREAEQAPPDGGDVEPIDPGRTLLDPRREPRSERPSGSTQRPDMVTQASVRHPYEAEVAPVPGGLETSPYEQTLRAPAGSAPGASLDLPPAADHGATILAPRRTPSPRVTPAPVPTAASAAPVATAPAVGAPAPAVPAAPARTARPAAPKPARPAKPSALSGLLARARASVTSARTSVMSRPARERKMMMGIAAGAVLVAAIAVGVYFVSSAPVATGTVVIDAVPWGTITAIRSEDGDAVPLPAQAATPLVMSLPVGTYQLSIAGPPLDGQTQQITVRVDAEATSSAPVVRFRTLTPEEYFEQYLGASAALAESAPGDPAVAPGPEGSAPETATPAEPSAPVAPAALPGVSQ